MIKYEKVAQSFGKFFNEDGLQDILGRKAEKK
jgi:hypothetical protein